MNWLLVDDDPVFGSLMQRGLQRQGDNVWVATDAETALALLAQQPMDRAVLDLKLGPGSGLALLPRLLACQPGLPVVVLTGYAAVATAVDAIKLGASHYLAKPVTAAQLRQAFEHQPQPETHATAPVPASVERLTWEYIQQTLAAQGGNISATARALGMHRRTLQRRLGKKPSRS